MRVTRTGAFPKRHPRNQPRRGLTLAEMIVSLTLLTLLLVSVVNLFPSSMANVRLIRTAQLARTAAQNRIEILASQPFNSLQVGTLDEETIKLSDGQPVHLKTSITAVDGYEPKRLKRLRCEAEWQGRARRQTAVQELYVNSIRR